VIVGPSGAEPLFLDSIAPISDHEFKLFSTFVKREIGINLSESKRTLLVGRLAGRLRKLGMKDFLSYYRRVQDDDSERVFMFDAISTNETHFFREPSQFSFLETKVIPWWCEGGLTRSQIRVWSAGCSSGEEPYSIAMTLLARLPPESGLSFEILATDISTKVLERARAAVWPINKAEEIPLGYRKSFMLKGQGPEAGKMMARPSLRSRVRFERVNFQDDPWPVKGSFDLIFCRNALIYFDAAGRHRIVRRLLDRLTPDGYFFMGHSESLDPAIHDVVRVGPVVYQRSPDAMPAASPATHPA
jgi:chemotaxis protein methyltransferase CheR